MYQASDERLVMVRPSDRQLTQQKMEFYGFIHYGMNTYTDREWGDGTEAESLFSPIQADTDQWARVAKEAGMKGLILTCKHHDGFCLWPSAYTEHSVKNSPYQEGTGDIVRDMAQSCKNYGLRFGIYLSPWDRNATSYGSGKEYDDYYVNQLTELLTNYGDIFCVWMDGACGEGPNGKVQKYDWERYYETVRSLQPCACISVSGPDIRWCGNEAGDTRESEWSVVPAGLSKAELIAKKSQQEDDEQFRQKTISSQEQDLGSRDRLEQEMDLIWYPAEVNLSIRPGWFYHKKEDSQVCSLEHLKTIYLNSVGGNAMMLLNLPPNPQGYLAQPDELVLTQFGKFLKEDFAENLAQKAQIQADSQDKQYPAENLGKESSYYATEHGVTQASILLQWKERKTIRYVVLQEYLPLGQRVEQFEIINCDQEDKILAKGTVIGQKRIVAFAEPVPTKSLKIRITDARVSIALETVAVYG